MDLDLAKALALQLMKDHLTLPAENRLVNQGYGVVTRVVIPAGTPWEFDFDRGRRRFGCCHFGKRKITLSRALVALNDEPAVRDTILHEIAHANAGPRAKHGPIWKAHARILGCRPEACYDSDTVKAPVSPWMGWCPGCKKQFRRYRRPPACSQSCGVCSPRKYNPEFQLQWARTSSCGTVAAETPTQEEMA
jgi:predicted SprT family Zn-dependent metalloprotease